MLKPILKPILKRIFCSLSFMLLLHSPIPSTAQEEAPEVRRKRQDKIETILRTQDLRTPHDGVLVSALSDPDPLVRERAALAFGSLQDSAVIGPLTHMLTEDSPQIQETAAFALGQTGMALSPQGREQLEYDLIWKRLPSTAARDRLIDGISKFGTPAGLNDLLLSIGNTYPLASTRAVMLAIARFAWRGTVSDDAVRYLLRFIKPADDVPWETLYAFQRIGDHPLTRTYLEELVLLWRSPDPLVRLNLAVLLGKLKDVRTSVEPLERMARFDADWRVRVAALRSLAQLPLEDMPAKLDAYRELFFDSRHAVAVTAVSSVPAGAVRATADHPVSIEIRNQLSVIARNEARNFEAELQGEAAITLAKIQRSGSLPLLRSLRTSDVRARSRLATAYGASADSGAINDLEALAADKVPAVAIAAFEGMRDILHAYPEEKILADRVYASLLAGVDDTDPAVVATCADIVTDSILIRPESAGRLIDALGALRSPADLDARLSIIAALGALGDHRAIAALQGLLNDGEPAVGKSAAAALAKLADHSRQVPYRQPVYVDFDFEFLERLPESVPVTIETIRGEITAELYPRLAPFSVMNFLKLAERRRLFDGTVFHRVVPTFVTQGGDPRQDGWGGPGYSIRSEFNPLSYETGVIGMASSGKDTEGSQFFFTQSPQPHLDGRYTVIGRVTGGQDIVDRLQIGDRLLGVRMSGESD
jgi:peptidylprolyl isomerase